MGTRKRRHLTRPSVPNCHGRTIFNNKKKAEGSASLARKRSGKDIEAYRCEEKSHFHIGPPNRKKRALANAEAAALSGGRAGSGVSPVDQTREEGVSRVGAVTGSLWSAIR